MSEFPIHPVPANFKDAHINPQQYQEMYQRSIEDPEGFWGEKAAEFLTWDQPWDKVMDYDFVKGTAQWFAGGKLNVSYNCIDRHLPERAEPDRYHLGRRRPCRQQAHHLWRAERPRLSSWPTR